MLLLELFDNNNKSGDGGVVEELRGSILDMLTPLAAQGVPFITVQAIVNKMHELHSGLQIDRALVMHVLDPAEVKMVSKIEGDRVYFTLAPKDNKAGEDEAQKNADKVSANAMSQAKDNLKDQNNVTPEVAANPKTGPF